MSFLWAYTAQDLVHFCGE